MASPQPDEFTRISNELYAAIIRTDFSKRQRKILDLVIRMSYGCQKRWALLRFVDYGLCGIGRSKVRTELEALTRARVLVWDGNERVALQKDYELWEVPRVRGYDEARYQRVLSRNVMMSLEDVPVSPSPDSPGSNGLSGQSSQNGNIRIQNGNGSIQNGNRSIQNGNMPAEIQGAAPAAPDEDRGEQEGGAEQATLAEERPRESVQPTGEAAPPAEPVVDDASQAKPEAPPPATIEEVFARHPRYSAEQYAVIRRYWEVQRLRRRTGRIAPSVVSTEMDYWELFEAADVVAAVGLHAERYQTKDERYTRGIIRNMKREREMIAGGRVRPRGRSPGQRGDYDDVVLSDEKK